MSFWFVLVLEALTASAALFAAHEIPVNTKHIEPAMARGSVIAYILGFFYYAAALSIPLALIHFGSALLTRPTCLLR